MQTKHSLTTWWSTRGRGTRVLRTCRSFHPVALLWAILACAGRPCVHAEQRLVVGINQYKPLVCTDPEGKAQGIFIDVLEYVASKEGWELEYRPGAAILRRRSGSPPRTGFSLDGYGICDAGQGH